MAKGETPDFDDLEPVTDDEYDDDDDATWLDLDEEGDQVVGELRSIKENAGPNDSRLYELSRGIGDKVLIWGKASINRKVDKKDIGPGDVLGIGHTGDYYTTDNGEFVDYEVRTL